MTHLQSNHINETPPRYNKGTYSKPKPAKKQYHKAERLSLQSLTQLPLSLLSPSVYHKVSSPLHHPSPLQLSIRQTTSSLPPYQSIQLNKSCVIIHCGGIVMSCASMMNDSDAVVVVSCGQNDDGIAMNRRGVKDTPKDGFISCYSLLSFQPLLHFTHHHRYAVQMKWLHHSSSVSSFGVLCCVFVDGVIECFKVASFPFHHSQIPRIHPLHASFVSLEPSVHIELSVRATSLTQHDFFDDIVVVGYEDGSLRTIRLEESSWSVLSVMRSDAAWYRCCPIRSLCCSSYHENEVVAVDEVSEVCRVDCRGARAPCGTCTTPRTRCGRATAWRSARAWWRTRRGSNSMGWDDA